MPPFLSAKRINIFGFVSAIGLIAIAFYFQFAMDLEPCPLCIMQRLIVLLLGLIFFAGIWIKKPCAKRAHAFLCLLFSIFGIGISSRQVYLQSLPPESQPACGPGLNYMLEHFPLSETIKTMFVGTGDCAQVQWTFLHLSIPAWMLVLFFAYLILSALLFFKRA